MVGVNGVRVAKATSDLAGLERFYGDGLGFAVAATFRDHDGFDGIVFEGLEGRLHVEFTVRAGHGDTVAPRPADDLLVLYFEDVGEWKFRVERMVGLGYEISESENPYWNTAGKMFRDGDGNGVVLYSDFLATNVASSARSITAAEDEARSS